MLTIEKLKEYGADVDSGLARCRGMQDFYLRLVNMELDDKNFQALKEAMEKRDAKAAFEALHALKGAVGNLSLTPLFAPINEMTELLRGADTMPGADGLYAQIQQELGRLKAMAE